MEEESLPKRKSEISGEDEDLTEFMNKHRSFKYLFGFSDVQAPHKQNINERRNL